MTPSPNLSPYIFLGLDPSPPPLITGLMCMSGLYLRHSCELGTRSFSQCCLQVSFQTHTDLFPDVYVSFDSVWCTCVTPARWVRGRRSEAREFLCVGSYLAACCRVMQCDAACCSVLQCAAVCRSVLQCVAVCCSVLQCVAVWCTVRPQRRERSYM